MSRFKQLNESAMFYVQIKNSMAKNENAPAKLGLKGHIAYEAIKFVPKGTRFKESGIA